jgi:hypothetical protein
MRFLPSLQQSALVLLGILIGAIVFSTLSVLVAWSGPTSAAPTGNVAPPINVGAVDQVKNGGLALNALAVFGNAFLSGTSRYLNFGTASGESGYGIRDNSGTIEFKNSGGSWSSFLPSAGITSMTFADGTTQTTAATGGVAEQTTASCAIRTSVMSGISRIAYACTTVSCPAGYVRSGCSVGGTNVGGPRFAAPSGTGACSCQSQANDNAGTCYVYFVK